MTVFLISLDRKKFICATSDRNFFHKNIFLATSDVESGSSDANPSGYKKTPKQQQKILRLLGPTQNNLTSFTIFYISTNRAKGLVLAKFSVSLNKDTWVKV